MWNNLESDAATTANKNKNNKREIKFDSFTKTLKQLSVEIKKSEVCFENKFEKINVKKILKFNEKDVDLFLNSEDGNNWLQELQELFLTYDTDKDSSLQGSSEINIPNKFKDFNFKELSDDEISVIALENVDVLNSVDLIEKRMTENQPTIEDMNLINLIEIFSQTDAKKNMDLRHEIKLHLNILGNSIKPTDVTINENEPSDHLELLKSLINLEETIKNEDNSLSIKMQLDFLLDNNTDLNFARNFNLLNSDYKIEMMQNSKTEQILKSIKNEIIQILDNYNKSKVNPKTANRMLELMETWSRLINEINESTKSTTNINLNRILKLEDEMPIQWKALMNAFNKRNQMAQKSMYNQSAKVSSADVMKWMQYNSRSIEETTFNDVEINYQIPFSKVEQYIIHAKSEVSTTEQQNEEVLKDISKIIESSKFLRTNSLNRQLVIHIRPNHLGEMIVKMREVNGEMFVKLIVNSTEARKMLESNINQLRHMFSPHQILIEKQENSILINENPQEAQHESDKEEEQQDNDKKERDQFNEKEYKNFRDTFSEVLMD